MIANHEMGVPMKLGIPEIALSAAAAVFGVSVAVAQTGGPPNLSFADPPHKNLKVLPQDIPGPQLLSTMKFFSLSLGVRCTFCHVGEEGKPLSTFDFASDAKREKQTARKMLAMVHRHQRAGLWRHRLQQGEGDLLHLPSRCREAADRAATANTWHGAARCACSQARARIGLTSQAPMRSASALRDRRRVHVRNRT